MSRGYGCDFTSEGTNPSSSASPSSGSEELVFSIFNPKHSPLMLDANSLSFLLQEKPRILGVGNAGDCCVCLNGPLSIL